MIYRRLLYTEGVLYDTHIFPDTAQVVREIKMTLENYVYLDYDDFEKCRYSR